MRILLTTAALAVCFASAASALTEQDRRHIAGAVVAQDPTGTSALSHGFTQGSGGITPRQAAGLPDPGYIVRKRHMKKKYR